MAEKLLTANALALKLRTYPHCVMRAVRAETIAPDFIAGRILLFKPSRLPAIRAGFTASK